MASGIRRGSSELSTSGGSNGNSSIPPPVVSPMERVQATSESAETGVSHSPELPHQPHNLGQVMHDIWPQIEQRIAQEALTALRGRSAGIQRGHAHTMAQPVLHPSVISDSGNALDDHPVIIDLTDLPGGPAPNASQSNVDGLPRTGQSQGGAASNVPSIRSLLKSMEGSLPFVFLMLAKVLYNHRLGILILVGLFGTFFHANSSLRRLVTQRESRNWFDSLGGLAWIVALLSANIFFIYYVFEDQKLFRSLYMVLPEVEGPMDLWNLLWITGITDFVVKFCTILLKALVALMPKQVLLTKKKGKYFMMIENLSQSYRSILPISPWLVFLQNVQYGGQWFSVVLIILYIVIKGNHIFHGWLDLKRAVGRFRLDVSYGSIPSREQLQSADNCCPICQDKFSDPVLLTCRHIFCEDCVSMWFDRERTCPLCRANIVDNPQWRDGTTASNLQIY